MKRLLIASTIAALALTAATTASPALAQNAGKAAALNEEGKKLFGEKKYFEAYKKFKQAVDLDPKGKYWFNVCFTLNFLERYRDAVEACEQVEPNGADPQLLEKTNGLLAELRKRVPADEPPPPDDPDGPPPDDPDGPDGPDTPPPDDPNNPPPPGGNPPPGPVQAEDFIAGAAPDLHSYRWSIGGELGPIVNLGIGADGGDEQYSAGGFGVRGFVNFLLSERLRFGLQGSLGLAAFGPGDNSFDDTGLTLADIGGAAFVHIPIGRNLVYTPLVGLGFTLMQPDVGEVDSGEAFVAANLRVEPANVAYLFGNQGQHAIVANVGINVYTAASGDALTGDAADFNLDKPASALMISVGYMARFSTPFGASPLITLE